MRDTFDVTGSPAHIAVEWILTERPRRYGLTCITLYMGREGIEYLLYAYEYGSGDKNCIENLPFVRPDGKSKRPAGREEMKEYYQAMVSNHPRFAKTFSTRKEYQAYIEENFQLVSSEWEAIVKINSAEGGVEKFFEQCSSTVQLVDRLLIPVVEKGLAGEGTKDFARLFDNHRQQFKEYLELATQLEENKDLLEQVFRLVEQYKDYDQKEKTYNNLQSRAKGLVERIEKEIEEGQAKLATLEQERINILRQKELLQQQKISLDIAYLQQEQKEQEKTLDKLAIELEEKEEQIKQLQQKIAELKMARLQKQYKEKKEKQVLYQKELEELDQSPDIATWQESKQKLLQQMRFCYDRKEITYQQYYQEAQERQKELEAICQEKKKALQEKEQQSRNVQFEIVKKQRDIGHYQQQMDDIAQDILSDCQKEQVEKQLPLWQERSQEVGTSLTRLLEQLSQWKAQEITLQEDIEKARQEQVQKAEKQKELETELNQIDNFGFHLIERLHQLSPQDSTIHSIYHRESSLRHRLEEKRKYLEEVKEKSLEQERTFLRYYELYKDNHTFTADPALEQEALLWRRNIPSLQMGTDYVEMVLQEHKESTIKKLYQNFPFWPLALICTTADREKLYRLVAKKGSHWTHPIYILSDQEAQKTITAPFHEEEARKVVIPTAWPTMTDSRQFYQWLQSSSQEANRLAHQRKEKEEKARQWQALQEDFHRFWNQYSFEKVYQPLKEALSTTQKERLLLEQDLEAKKKQLKALEKFYNEGMRKKSDLELEQQDLYRRYQQGLKWKEQQSKKQQALLEVERLEKDSLDLKVEEEKIRSQKNLQEKYLEEQKEQVRDYQSSLSSLQNEEEYELTRSIKAQQTDQALESIKTQYKEIEKKLQGLQSSRLHLEERVTSLKNEIIELNKQIEELSLEYNAFNIATISFPPQGEKEIKKLAKLLQEDNKSKEQLLDEQRFQKTQCDRLEATIEEKIKNYQKLFPRQSLYTFNNVSLQVVEKNLKEEEQRSSQKEQWLTQEVAKASQHLKELERLAQKLAIAQERYHFRLESIAPIALSAQEEQDYPYRRGAFLEALLEELEKEKKSLEEEHRKVEKQRQHFEGYCRRQLNDEKTKQQSLKGVEQRNNYKEIKEWSDRLQERIEAANHIAEDNMRTLDAQVQQFISHLHTHLLRICEELRSIPKMTAVRVEDRRREIFDFSIPSWEETEGKMRLRQHIEWMLQELEKEKFQTDKDQEDKAKVQSHIESWLHPKQLLQIVASNQEIKVRCRKVTNDNKVSATLTDWPTSEKWSGGEKWSKNMTLFLGILNYLAEKRQHISKGQGNYRVVILDNPFGKASSSHVLSPVFYIARQLGFQIVALTAHAEGKFLRDYFPVLYSCRLRPTKDPSISIVETQKDIFYAFFQDQAPHSIDRLEETEQLTLL
ncbi:hypothetical protein FTV88_2539 [Heliorestis convoluta]|uniref:Chromosome segregation ATPase n=1 Tax=Heliorestis convoluta TaxID=356322 RepID=A0A5Q2N5M1_9FIRM|nr:hypothetical protein FTV88_2539 [Heliorestis convoluta]